MSNYAYIKQFGLLWNAGISQESHRNVTAIS
jgi:hypothetical protein